MSAGEIRKAYREPSPPCAEMGFYASAQPSEQTFADVVSAVVNLGGKVVGPALIGDEGRLDQVLIPNDHSVSERHLSSLTELRGLLEGSPRVVYGVRLGGGFQHAANRYCDIRALSIDLVDSGPSRHSIVARIDGRIFDRSSNRALRRSAAQGMLADFRRLIENVKPSYAAFTVLWPLLTPKELAVGNSHSLRDVYLAENYVGRKGIEEIQAASNGYPCSDLEHGVLSLTGSLNWALGSGTAIDEADLRVSEVAAKLIMAAERRHESKR